MRSYLVYFTYVFSFFALVGCGSGPKLESNSAEGKYNYAIALIEDDRYEEALIELRDIKNRHPYSRFATLSELAIADLHYKRESFIEAQASYELFKSLHPKHEKTAHVSFRLGMSLFKQLPSSIDRDLTAAKRAIFHFDQVIKKYPGTDYATQAADRKAESQKMLMLKEFYIADFYFKRENYISALGRYERAVKKYPGLGFDARALFGAAASAYRSGAVEKGDQFLKTLENSHPETEYVEKARKEKKKYAKR